MKGMALRSLVCVFFGLAGGLVGCATAGPSGHRGLLDGVHAAYGGHAVAGDADVGNVSSTIPRRQRASRLTRATAGEPRVVAAPAVVPARALADAGRDGGWRWPLARVEITSPFGRRGREFHEGIDLKAQSGTPVLASQEGTVIYAGNAIRGYGKLVVLRHLKKISTIYAHNSQLLVKTGQFVHQGQEIAISGQTGHVTGPHLHFEMRDGMAALNPMRWLPRLRGAPVVPVVETAPIVRPPRGRASKIVAQAASQHGVDD